MFLVKTNRFGTTRYIFTWEDPRKAGFKGEVLDDVSLDFNMEAIFLWPEGTEMPSPCLGRSRVNPKSYKVFRSRGDLDAAQYEFIASAAPLVFGSYLDYLRVQRDPPNPEEIAEEDWYDYLDKLDEESRRLRERTPWPEAPGSTARDEVAEWVAKQHFITDVDIYEIWYLPHEAEEDEIRLLELSERATGNDDQVTPVEFGLVISDKAFRLVVADISTEQLDRIKSGASRLPAGWSLVGNRVWRRRKPHLMET